MQSYCSRLDVGHLLRNQDAINDPPDTTTTAAAAAAGTTTATDATAATIVTLLVTSDVQSEPVVSSASLTPGVIHVLYCMHCSVLWCNKFILQLKYSSVV